MTLKSNFELASFLELTPENLKLTRTKYLCEDVETELILLVMVYLILALTGTLLVIKYF